MKQNRSTIIVVILFVLAFVLLASIVSTLAAGATAPETLPYPLLLEWDFATGVVVKWYNPPDGVRFEEGSYGTVRFYVPSEDRGFEVELKHHLDSVGVHTWSGTYPNLCKYVTATEGSVLVVVDNVPALVQIGNLPYQRWTNCGSLLPAIFNVHRYRHQHR